MAPTRDYLEALVAEAWEEWTAGRVREGLGDAAAGAWEVFDLQQLSWPEVHALEAMMDAELTRLTEDARQAVVRGAADVVLRFVAAHPRVPTPGTDWAIEAHAKAGSFA